MKAFPIYKCRRCGKPFTVVEGIELGEDEKLNITEFNHKMINLFEVQIHDNNCIRLIDSDGNESEYWLVQAHKCGMLELGFGDLVGVKFN